MIRVALEKPGFLALRFDPWGVNFNRYLSEVRTLSQRRYVSDPSGNRWVIPISCISELQSKVKDLSFDEESSDQVQKLYDRKELSKAVSAEAVELNGFGVDLLPHQHAGVRFIETADGEVLILDETRVGKTIQTLAYIQRQSKIRKIVVVAPSIAKWNWKYESEKLLDPPPIVSILSGRKADSSQVIYPDPSQKDRRMILVINYDILKGWLSTLQEFETDLLIVDESHQLKDRKSQTYKNVASLRFNLDKRGLFKSRRIPKFLSLTATPIFNRSVEAWSNLHLTKPEEWSSFWKFAQTFADVSKNPFGGWEIGESKNEHILHDRMQYYVLRRKLEDVLPHLPKVTREFSYLDLGNHRCKTEWEDFKERSKVDFLEESTRLRQLTLEAKLPHMLEWIDSFLESGKKLVVFGFYHNALSAIYEKYRDIAVRITGKESAEQKDSAIQRFQNDPDTKLAVCSQNSVLGVNLTAAHHALFTELPWSRELLTQNEGRLLGLMQKESSVVCNYLICPGTIDDYFVGLVDKKSKVVSQAVDGKKKGFGE